MSRRARASLLGSTQSRSAGEGVRWLAWRRRPGTSRWASCRLAPNRFRKRTPNSRNADIPRTAQASRLSMLAAVAALLLVAFGLGAFSRGWLAPSVDAVVENPPRPAEVEPPGPLMATVSLSPERGSSIPATLQIPVMAIGNSAAEQPASHSISEYDRQKWERRGYQLTKERRFLPAQLPNGKKIMVPVDKLKANYVGSKVS